MVIRFVFAELLTSMYSSHEIEIPEYLSKKELSDKLILAISEGNVGYAFG